MKKILFFIGYLEGGGAEKVLCDIVANLNKKKYDVTVMTLYDRGVYIDEIKKYAHYKTCFKSLSPGKTFIKKIWNIIMLKYRECFLKVVPARYFYKLNIKEKYDIEIAFLEGVCTKVISQSPNTNSKKYSWVHSDMQENSWTDKFYKSISEQINCYKKFDKIMCVSETVKNAFVVKFNIEDNVYVQYNPVNEKLIREKSKENVDDIIINDKFKIVTVGRLDPQKGYDRLLKVHKRLIDDGLEFELWLLGKGPQEKELKSFIEDNKLEDSVKLLGFKSNPYKYMKQADLFVCSSRSEGFSTVATEATILGIPIVTTNCAGMNELLGDSEFGIITENNEADLYNGMNKILSDKCLYNYYKLKSSQRSKNFLMKERIHEIEKLF